jgi:hypothetical protein
MEVSPAAIAALEEAIHAEEAYEPKSMEDLALLVFPDDAECCTIGLNVELFRSEGTAPEGFADMGRTHGWKVYGFSGMLRGLETGRLLIKVDKVTDKLVAFVLPSAQAVVPDGGLEKLTTFPPN